jgi:hypothetical protein
MYMFLAQVAATGYGLVIAVIFKPKVAQLAGVVVAALQLMFGGVTPPLTQLQNQTLTNVMSQTSIMRFYVGGLFVHELQLFPVVLQDKLHQQVLSLGYTANEFERDTNFLIIMSVAGLLIAFILMVSPCRTFGC